MRDNKTLREKFHQYLEANYNPPLRKLHKVIGVGYSDLCSWSKGSMEYGETNLKKIAEFLEGK